VFFDLASLLVCCRFRGLQANFSAFGSLPQREGAREKRAQLSYLNDRTLRHNAAPSVGRSVDWLPIVTLKNNVGNSRAVTTIQRASVSAVLPFLLPTTTIKEP